MSWEDDDISRRIEEIAPGVRCRRQWREPWTDDDGTEYPGKFVYQARRGGRVTEFHHLYDWWQSTIGRKALEELVRVELEATS